MKPEHAQEIYETIGCLSALAIQNFNEAQTEVVKKVVNRAEQLLGLERPDVPEPGTIVEYVLEDDWDIDSECPDYRWGKVDDFEESLSVIFQTDGEGSIGYEEAFKWRYPGEKEWRE